MIAVSLCAILFAALIQVSDLRISPRVPFAPSAIVGASAEALDDSFFVSILGRNPFGNAPIMKLYASNNQDQLQYLCKIPMQASLGNMQYTNFVGDKVMHSMNVYSEFKLRNPASSVLITTPLV